MENDEFGGFAPPPYKPEEAVLLLQRALRGLHLKERGDAFELAGKPVLVHHVQDGAVHIMLARRPALAPEWDKRVLRSAADQRKLLDDVKSRLTRWDREE